MADIKKIIQGPKVSYSKYQWPANKLEANQMRILYNWRRRTGTPINELLKQAIQELDKIVGRRR